MTSWTDLMFLLAVACLLTARAVLSRLRKFHELVAYAELERMEFKKCRNLDDVREILGQALSAKADLLCHRAMSLISRTLEEGRISESEELTAKSDFQCYQRRVRINPYRADENVPMIPLFFGGNGELRRELELHRQFVRDYNKLFGIPKNVI